MAALLRVLVVDDSAFARKVVREILETSPLIEVVGIARDGLEALEKIAALKPHVVTLDLQMPGLDGLGVMQALPKLDAPSVIIVSMADEDSALGMAALDAGAIDIVHKPSALAVHSLYDMSADLLAKVKMAGEARLRTVVPYADRPSFTALAAPKVHPRRASTRIIVIGASTGGPQALTRVIRELPADLGAPVAIVLHIPVGYTDAFARRVNDASAIAVAESVHGAELQAGQLVVAQAGMHLTLSFDDSRLRTQHSYAPHDLPHRPSVDVLFASAARLFGDKVLGVVLTGMGHDGLEGARAIRAAGGSVITEAEASCVVYGMPRAVADAGLSAAEVPIEQMAAEIVRRS